MLTVNGIRVLARQITKAALHGILLIAFAAAMPTTAEAVNAPLRSGDEPVIGTLPAAAINPRLYVTGFSRAHQMLRIYRQGYPEVETRSNESGDFAAGLLLSPGNNAIQVVAVDFGKEGERSDIASVEYVPIRADAKSNQNPNGGPGIDAPMAPVLDAPASPAATNPITVTGTALAGVTLRFFVNGVQVQSGVSDGSGHFSVHVPIEDDVNTLYAVAEDESGQSPASNTVAVSYTNTVGRTQGGTLTGDTAWTRGDGTPYAITSNLIVPAGVTLWLEPGATLRFSANTKLLVQGQLAIRGTAANAVALTSSQATPTVGYWTGVEVASTATSVSIDYAQIEYANYGLSFNGSAAGVGQVTHTLIRNNTRGINVAAPNASPTIADGNEITANRYGIYVVGNSNAAQNPLPVVTGNSIHDNVNGGSTVYDYYSVSFGNPGSTALNATGNWWGTADAAVISSHIYDWTDSATAPVVNYGGYLGSDGGSPVFAGPTLYGQIASNTTLAPQEYQVLGPVEVVAGVTLTIPAGAVLKFQGNYVLRVRGSLQVSGTSSQRVMFTSGKAAPAAGNWGGIEIAAAATTVSIDYAQIEYANYGLSFNGSAAGVGQVMHTLIRNNTRGINVAAPNASPTIADGNEITANRYGIYVTGSSTAAQNPLPVVTGNSIHDNVNGGSTVYDYYSVSFDDPGSTVLSATGNWWGTADAAVISSHIYDWTDNANAPVVNYGGYLGSDGGSPVFAGPTLYGQITSNTNLSTQEYHVLGPVEIMAGVTLTIPAGAVLKFQGNYLMRIRGSLQVSGTSSQRVMFTSGKAAPAAGNWSGIEIATTATAVAIDYAQIEYANYGLSFNGSAAGVGQVTHTLIRNNTRGVSVAAPNASPTIANGNEITANRYGIYVTGSSNAAQNPLPVVTGNSIHDNVNGGSTVYDYYSVSFGNPGSTVLNATGNWWGTADAAVISSHIYDWADNAAAPVVNYGGYLGSDGGSPVFGGPTLSGQITSNMMLAAQEYQVLGPVEIMAGATLAIPAGAILKFQANYVLRIRGSLQVSGTLSQRAVFTSGKVVPAISDWGGIEIMSTATNVSIDYAQIEYANYGLNFNGSAAGVGQVTHTLIRNNTRGVNVAAPNAAPTITEGNEITANRYGIYVGGNSNAAQNPLPLVTGNSIHDNVYSGNTIYDYYAAANFGNPGSTVLNATGNWWGTNDYLVIGSHVYDRRKSAGSALVAYDGYLASASETPPTIVAYGLIIVVPEARPLEAQVASGTFLLTAPGQVTLEVHRESDDAVVYANTQAYAGGQNSFEWAGTDSVGAALPVATYHVALIASDGVSTTTYDPPFVPLEASVSGVVPSNYDPFRNVFWKIDVTMDSLSPALLTLCSASPCSGGFKVFENIYYPPGHNWIYWDGRDPSGQIVTQQSYMYFPPPILMRPASVRVAGTQTVITGTGSAPNIEVKSNPYFITHSYEEISTLIYRIDQDSYVTVKLLPPGIYDPANSAAIVLLDEELQRANLAGQPVDHAVEWRGYDLQHINHIKTADEGAFTFTIEARNAASNVSTLYRGVLNLRR